MRLLPYGPDAVLVELDDLAQVEAVRADLADARRTGDLPGVVDVVPAARTVLVVGGDAPAVVARLRDVDLGDTPAGTDGDGGSGGGDRGGSGVVELDVHYDGEDLDLVAADAGLDRAGVIDAHTGTSHRVAFGGFAPGFAYLTGLPSALCQPRLTTPRTRVPAGSVGVAGEFSGVYPRSSPGGWRLLGRLADDAPTLFDPDRDPPALLVPGTWVRFRAVSEESSA